MSATRRLSLAALAGGVAALALSSTAPVYAGAVSMPNGSISLGGTYYSFGSWSGDLGAVFATPLGMNIGFQIDGEATLITGPALFSNLGARLFFRDPSFGAAGVDATVSIYPGFQIYSLEAAVAGYLGSFTVEASAGWAWSSTGGDGFIGTLGAALYLTPDVKLSAGYRYLDGDHSGFAALEVGFPAGTMDASAFVRSEFDAGFFSISAGVAVQFGGSGSLIARDREDQVTARYLPLL